MRILQNTGYERMTEINILLVDADSKKGFPNLALMKLSAYHKAQGHNIDLIKGLPDAPPLTLYDRTYISVVFYQNKDKALDYALTMPNAIVGGSGWGLDNKLEDEIEHILPDYSLYDVDFSMGYTSRGCIRSCGFCVVPEKEGKIRHNAFIQEFHNLAHKKLILLDNNFLAGPNSLYHLGYIEQLGLKVNFNQGLDFRTLTHENTLALSRVKSTTWNFNARRISFAFDSMNMEKSVRDGVEMLEAYGMRPNMVHVYILVGYDTTIDQDLKRIEIIRELDAHPYIMRYNQSYGPNEILKHLSRWVNRRIYRNVPFSEYDYSNSKESYQKTFGKFCMHGVIE